MARRAMMAHAVRSSRIEIDYDANALAVGLCVRRTKYNRFAYRLTILLLPISIDIGIWERRASRRNPEPKGR